MGEIIPIKSKANTYKWLSLLLVGIVLYLAFCNKPAIPEPIVKTVKEQQTIIRHDTVEHKFNVDSIGKLISDANNKADYWRNAFNISSNEVGQLENSLSDYISKTTIPDSCKTIVANIQLRFDKIISSNKKAFNDCDSTINAKDVVIQQQKSLIKEDSTAYRKLVSDLDTSFVQQDKLTAYIKKIKPRTEITIGASAYGINQWGIGLNLGVRNRRGTTYSIGVIQLGLKPLNYSLTVTKPLFKL